jgi:hypothetical protein
MYVLWVLDLLSWSGDYRQPLTHGFHNISGFGCMDQGAFKLIGVAISLYLREVLSDGLLAIEVVGHVEGDEVVGHFPISYTNAVGIRTLSGFGGRRCGR